MIKKLSKRKKIIGIISGFILSISVGLYFVLTDAYTNAKFRTMRDDISSTEKVNLAGLREMKASGGPYVDFRDLRNKLSTHHNNVIIVDAMGDYTGQNGYLNGIHTSYFGYHRPDPDLRYLIRRLLYTGTFGMHEEKVISEREMAEKHGFGYVNIRIDSKLTTSDEVIDQFLEFVDSLPENVWLHFHCRLGKGRTSMLLNLYDIMKNAPHGVALKDIIKRQHLLGSRDLFDTTVWKVGSSYSSTALKRRKQLMEDFYIFVCQRKKGGVQMWSDWRRQKEALTPLALATPLQSE